MLPGTSRDAASEEERARDVDVRTRCLHAKAAELGRVLVEHEPSGSCAVQMVAKPDDWLRDMRTGKKGEQVCAAFIAAAVPMQGESTEDGDVSLLEALHALAAVEVNKDRWELAGAMFDLCFG